MQRMQRMKNVSLLQTDFLPGFSLLKQIFLQHVHADFVLVNTKFFVLKTPAFWFNGSTFCIANVFASAGK